MAIRPGRARASRTGAAANSRRSPNRSPGGRDNGQITAAPRRAEHHAIRRRAISDRGKARPRRPRQCAAPSHRCNASNNNRGDAHFRVMAMSGDRGGDRPTSIDRGNDHGGDRPNFGPRLQSRTSIAGNRHRRGFRGGPRRDFSNFRNYHRNFNAPHRFRVPTYRRPPAGMRIAGPMAKSCPACSGRRDYWIDRLLRLWPAAAALWRGLGARSAVMRS